MAGGTGEVSFLRGAFRESKRVRFFLLKMVKVGHEKLN